MTPFKTSRLFSFLLLAVALAACGGGSQAETAGRVYFVEPADGATVSGPVQVRMAADGFAVEPAGEVKPGAGHLHIIVDADCVPAGQDVPRDDSHLHFGQGQLEADLELAPGAHRLCLQAADGAHKALAGPGMTHVISITVE